MPPAELGERVVHRGAVLHKMGSALVSPVVVVLTGGAVASRLLRPLMPSVLTLGSA